MRVANNFKNTKRPSAKANTHTLLQWPIPLYRYVIITI